MDAENEKLFKEYRNLIKNKNISLEKLVEAWVTHVGINPIENSEEDHDNSQRSNSQNEEDDVTFLEPCDSASQVGNIGQQIQKFLENRRLFNLRNVTPSPKIPPKILKVLAFLNQNEPKSDICSPATKKLKLDDAGEKKLDNVDEKKLGDVDEEKLDDVDEKTYEPTKMTIKFSRQSVLTLIDHCTRRDYDETFVDAVQAAGFVFLRRALKSLEEAVTNDNRDVIKRQDVLDLYKKLGLKYDEEDLKHIDQLFRPKPV